MTRSYGSKLILPGEPPPVKAKGVVHKLVAETAKALAQAVWEEGASKSNDFYAKWPSPEGFVRKRWQSFIQPARTHLAEMLHPSMHSQTSQEMRDQIHEALLLNAAVNPAQNSVDKLLN
jgi:hypothetical protein